MRKIFTLLFITFQAMHVIAQTCNALDPTFGSGGIRVGLNTSDGLNPKNIIVQPDNKIVQFGNVYSNGSHFSIIRYNSDGSLDNSFGQGGRVISASQYDYANYGAMQNDGKILVAGSVNNGGFVLTRYIQDGTLDNSFGVGGSVTATVSAQGNYASALAIQPDGKILAVGSSTRTDDCYSSTWSQYCPEHFTVFRFKNDGRFDSSFGVNGKVTTSVGADHAGIASSIVLQPDGKIVVAGSYLYNLEPDYYGAYYFSSSHFVMVRYHNNGVVDSSFGTNGIVGDASELQGTNAMSLQADGKILVTGDGGRPFEVDRYNINGILDSSFGTYGKQFNNFESWTHALMVLPDGKISVVGATRFNILIARLNIDGSFDTTFNGNGKLSLHLGPVGSYDNATAVGLQDGHVIVGGYSSYNTNNSYSASQLVLRLLDTIKGLRLVVTPRSTLTPCPGGGTRLVVNETGTIQWFNDGYAIPGAYDTVYTANQSGNYSVTVQNAKGCGEADPVHVLFNGLPVVITPSGSLNICEGDSVVLTANQSDNLQWYRNYVIIPGATNANYIAKSSGSYYVWVQNANGCGGSAPLDVTLNPVKPSISWDGMNLRTTSSNYNYQWFFNGDSIHGANSYLFKPTQLGTYKVVIPDYKCNNTSDDFILNCNVVGVPQPVVGWTGTQLAASPGFADYQWYFNGDSISNSHTNIFTPTQLGMYKVVVTGQLGCQNFSEFEVSCSSIAPPKPPIDWDTKKFSTGSGYAHYQWYQNDTAIAGATSNTYTPGDTQFGWYRVVVTDNHNCTSTSDKLPYFITAISDIVIGEAKLRVYPNPVNSVLNLDVFNTRGSKLQAQVYDVNGRLLQKQLLNQTHNQLRVDRLSAGVYQLVIDNGAQRIAMKIAVIK